MAPRSDVEHIVGAAEGLSSIAARYGLFWQTIWDDPRNAELKKKRGNPEVLLEGDRVFVRALQEKRVSCATGKRHVFRRKGVPVPIVLRLHDRSQQPFANCRFVLEVGSARYEGTTDADGVAQGFVAPAAEQGLVTVWPARPDYAETVSWSFLVSALAPVETARGIRERLRNIGIDCAGGDGPLDDNTRCALRLFQQREGFEVTGEADDATRQRLLAVHGS